MYEKATGRLPRKRPVKPQVNVVLNLSAFIPDYGSPAKVAANVCYATGVPFTVDELKGSRRGSNPQPWSQWPRTIACGRYHILKLPLRFTMTCSNATGGAVF